MATKRTLAITLVLVTTAGIVTPAFTGGGVVYATDTEPNDDFETAVAISEGTFSGEIVDGESDFFKLNASTTEALSAEVTSADNLDDLTLRIYDADRTQLASDGNAFQGIDATIKLPETGTYYVEVAGQSAGTNSSYTLNIDVVTPAENDQFAPNDDFGSAASIPEGSSEARIVGGESDFYQLEANATDAISVDITSADSLDDLAIRLYDAERSQLAADGNSFQGIDYTIKAPETGTYYIEVLGQ
ncbi:PPC domain-containing protein, partial [Haloplanus ruber]